MRRILGLVTLLIVLGGAQAEASNRSINQKIVEYRLIPVLKGEDLTAIELVIHFHADKDGQTLLELPDEWGGGVKYYEQLKEFKVIGATNVSAPTPSKRLIVSKPYAALSVRYHLDANLKRSQDVPVKDNFTYPVIAPDWFYIAGPSLIASVEGRDSSDVRFSWKLPKGWNGATNLEYPLAKNITGGPSQAVLIAGKDVHVTRMKVKSGDLRLAWRGSFTRFSPETFNKAVADIIKVEQDFWGEGQAHFLVTMAPMSAENNRSSIRGSGLGDSFAMAATPESKLDDLKIILAHEYFHSWNLERLGGFDQGLDEPRGYWFSEGFTDYYGRKLAFESGVVDAKQFAETWNESLGAYATSAWRTSHNDLIAEKVWSDYGAQKMPYQRGALMAALLDKKWKAQGKSLDGFMYVLRDQAKADEMAQATHMKLIDRLMGAAKTYGVDFSDLIERHMINGEAVLLPEDAFGPIFKVESVDVPVRYLGYNAEKTRALGQFVEVDPEGPAYRAGIRDGMKRVASEGGGNDSQTPITWHVLDLEGRPASFTFKPEGKTIVHSQKLILR